MKNFLLSIFVSIGSLFNTHQQVIQSPQVITNNTHITSNIGSARIHEDWNLFKDPKYAVQIEYPSDWMFSYSSSTQVANIILQKQGYILTVELCDFQMCKGAANQGVYDQNQQLSSTTSVSLNIDGQQAWREITPDPNGEDDPTLYFNFTFLRKVAPVTDQTGFNDVSKFTPVSTWFGNNRTLITVNYQLPYSATAENYDYSMINQMDEIVQTIHLIN